MTTRRNRPIQITDAPEHRSIPLERVEMRASDDNDNELILEGYASTFDEYDMYGGPSQYGWIERIDPKAFDVTLREKPDLHLLINHAGMPLARTKSGNLDLKADDSGLKVVARLDKRDPEVQSLAVKMERGDMDEMSFAFRVKAQEWRAADGFDEDDQSYRTITEVSLHKGDVSVVNWGANPTTSVGIRSVPEAVKFLANADESEFAEVRGNDIATTDMKVAQERLTSFRNEGKAPGPCVVIHNVNVGSEDEVRAVEGPTGTVLDGVVNEATEEREESEGITVKVTADSEIIRMLSERIEALEGIIAANSAEETAEEREETTEEVVEQVASTRLDEARATLGILPEKLSLAAALAFAD